MSDQEEKTLPDKRYASGEVTLSRWMDEIAKEDGTTVKIPSFELTRSYRDNEGNKKYTRNLKLRNLPDAITTMNAAYEESRLRIYDNTDAKTSSRPQPEPEPEEEMEPVA